MINYQGKFITNLSTIVSPVTELLQGKIKKNKSGIGQKNVKNLSSWLNRHLCPPGFYCTLSHHCQSVKLLMLHCMRSGVVISHIIPNNPEKPVAFLHCKRFLKRKKIMNKVEERRQGKEVIEIT